MKNIKICFNLFHLIWRRLHNIYLFIFSTAKDWFQPDTAQWMVFQVSRLYLDSNPELLIMQVKRGRGWVDFLNPIWVLNFDIIFYNNKTRRFKYMVIYYLVSVKVIAKNLTLFIPYINSSGYTIAFRGCVF